MRTPKPRRDAAPDRQLEVRQLLPKVFEHLLNHWKKELPSWREDPSYAEDLAQEGILKLCKPWIGDDWKGPATLKTYLVAIGLNAGRDLHRKDKLRKRDIDLSATRFKHNAERVLHHPSIPEDALTDFLDLIKQKHKKGKPKKGTKRK